MKLKTIHFLWYSSVLLLIIVISGYTQNTIEKVGPESGQQVYKNYCINCHGAEGQITAGQHSLQDSPMDSVEIQNVIREGVGGMPGFEAQLSEDEIDAVTAYVKQLQE